MDAIANRAMDDAVEQGHMLVCMLEEVDRMRSGDALTPRRQ